MDLARMLSRLESCMNSPEGFQALQRSRYMRQKFGCNLAYAQKILHNTERRSPNLGRRVSDVDLNQQRAIVKVLERKLSDLCREREIGSSCDDHLERHTISREDLLDRYGQGLHHLHDMTSAEKPKNITRTPTSALEVNNGVVSTPHMRPRRIKQNENDPMSKTSGRQSDPQLNSKMSNSVEISGSNIKNEDNVMSHHASEQEVLTSSLLSLATALKSSTLSFSDALLTSNPLVDNAASSLDRNVTGLNAAEKRMGMLRKMTEGKGWLGRLGLYGWVAALWVCVIFVMFVMPKLRM